VTASGCGRRLREHRVTRMWRGLTCPIRSCPSRGYFRSASLSPTGTFKPSYVSYKMPTSYLEGCFMYSHSCFREGIFRHSLSPRVTCPAFLGNFSELSFGSKPMCTL
jgi:hypothetical protein